MFSRAYVEITNVCNMACAFCPGTAREKGFMTPETFALLAGKLRRHTDYLYLHVMGEPLLHPQLAEILRICGDLGFRVCLTTNGTLLADRLPLLRDCPALHKVSVSLHSFEGNGRRDGLEDYITQAADSCLALAEGGVICALRLWNRGGAETENFRILQILGRILQKDIAGLKADNRGNRRLAEHLYLEPGERFDWPHPAGGTQDTQFCYGLRRQIAVLCDGTVVPCCLDSEGRLALGNLLTQELDDILAAPRAQAIRRGFGVELDVHLMQDGNLAVIHDASLLRTAGADVLVEDLTARELKAYRLEGTDEQIPLLEEVLELFQDRTPLIIELKAERGNHAALAEATCRMLDRYRVHYCIESFDPRCLIWLKKNRPEIVRGQLSEQFLRHGETAGHGKATMWLLGNLFSNIAAKPDFIAYRFSDRDNLCLRWCRKFYHVQEINWTIRTKEEMEAAEAQGNLVIFECFDPKG